jgi:hypothetical protein
VHGHALRLTLVALLVVVAHGCGGGGGGDTAPAELSVTDLIGTYDASVTGDAGARAGVGIVGFDDPAKKQTLAITIYDRGFNRIRVTGSIAPDGSTALEGQQRSGNIQALVTGTASVATDGTQRISGSLELTDGTSTFALEGPTRRDLRGFSGLYTLAFPTSPGPCRCATSAATDLRFGADGSGNAAETHEIDAAGTEVGRFEGGISFVSPSGRIVILDTHVALNAPMPLWLTGVVTIDARHATGAGEFSRGADPIVNGSWTATR